MEDGVVKMDRYNGFGRILELLYGFAADISRIGLAFL